MAVAQGTCIIYTRPRVTRLRKIFTAPSGLESTCLVMACGLGEQTVCACEVCVCR